MPRQRHRPYHPFDMAFGDSIAWMQVNHGIGGAKAPTFNAKNRGDFATGETAQIGAPPSEVLARLRHTLEENPEVFKGKRLFLSPGTSNNPDEMEAVRDILSTFKGLGENAPASIVVPGVGPGVANSQAVNTALGKMVGDAGYTYFDPVGVRWNQDNIHPASAVEMGTAAGRMIGAPAPTATTQAPPNQLAPQPPASLQLKPGGAASPVQRATADADPDAGLVLPDGTPVSVAKRLIRMHEPGSAGYNAAYNERAGLPAGYRTTETGFPIWRGNMGPAGISHGAGMYQYQQGTWDPIARELGISDFNPESQEKVTSAILQRRGMADWAPFNPKLAAAYQNYKRTGQLPDRPDPGQAMYGTTGPGGGDLGAGGWGPAPTYAGAPEGSGFTSGLTPGSLTRAATAPPLPGATDGYLAGALFDPRFRMPPGTAPGVGGAVPGAVAAAQSTATRPGGVASLEDPRLPPGAGGETAGAGGPSGEFTPPGEMTGMQALALAGAMAAGTIRAIPSTYDPRKGMVTLDTSMPHSALRTSPLGVLTPTYRATIGNPQAMRTVQPPSE
jgi:hypothetical protein